MKLFRFELQNFVNNRKKAWFFHFFRCRDWVSIRGHTFSLLPLNFCKMWTNYVSRLRVCFGMENNALRWLKWYFRKQCTPVIGEKLNSKSIKNADFWWYPRLVGLITGTASEDSNFGWAGWMVCDLCVRACVRVIISRAWMMMLVMNSICVAG